MQKKKSAKQEQILDTKWQNNKTEKWYREYGHSARPIMSFSTHTKH